MQAGMIAQTDKTKPQPQPKSGGKSIFDSNFSYLKVPREVFDIEGLNCAERMILARIIFWTRKGLACRETNRQFAELIGQSEPTAKRVVYRLIGLKLVDAHYVNVKQRHQKNAYRDLTALVAVDAEVILKRKAAQTGQKMGRTGELWSGKSAEDDNSRDGATPDHIDLPPQITSDLPPDHIDPVVQVDHPRSTTTNTTEVTKRRPRKTYTRPKRNNVLTDDEWERRRQHNHRVLKMLTTAPQGGVKKLQGSAS